MKTLQIDKQEFLEWYFDSDTIRDMGNIVYNALYKKGTYTINLQEIWKLLGYINIKHILNLKDVDKEDITDDEITEPSRKYKAKFVEV